MPSHENITDALPNSPEEKSLLEAAIQKLLLSAPEVWTVLDYDQLTAVEQRTLFLLTSAGMVERRVGFWCQHVNNADGVEAKCTMTGEGGFAEALQPLLARLQEVWRDAWDEWIAGGQSMSFPLNVEKLTPEYWRLTDQGVLAVQDLRSNKPDVVVDFVLKQEFFRDRPAVGGYGKLLALTGASGRDLPTETVDIGNWDQGAEKFAEVMTKAISDSLADAPGTHQPHTNQATASSTGAVPLDTGDEELESGVKTFERGDLIILPDHIELCGVRFCAGSRSESKRKLLNVLANKDKSGRTRAYSGKRLAEALQLKDATKIAGLVRDLRAQIKSTLQKHGQIDCDPKDIIQSGGWGYRLSEKLSVQEVDKGGKAPLQDHETGQSRHGDPVRDTVNGPVSDSVLPSGDTVATRQIRILQVLKSGQELRAPAIADELGSPLSTVKRDLKSLKGEGKIEFVGPPKTGHYRLCSRVDSGN
ncbi:hypothetical protein Mal52_53860 [Symmachiella dynata]|uniref:HTH domain protein n=2 Tax=Symmachiella dynata TaxID=2527995 RepID=A0A517ZWH9_9PLAN|nr:hypothetical protein Mal52_53860 [Symmachiella dynata]